jgi:hypothetical protein
MQYSHILNLVSCRLVTHACCWQTQFCSAGNTCNFVVSYASMDFYREHPTCLRASLVPVHVNSETLMMPVVLVSFQAVCRQYLHTCSVAAVARQWYSLYNVKITQLTVLLVGDVIQGIGSYLLDRCTDHGPWKPRLFTEAEAHQLIEKPAIIHFTGMWLLACLGRWCLLSRPITSQVVSLEIEPGWRRRSLV